MEKVKFSFKTHFEGSHWSVEIFEGNWSNENGYYMIKVIKGQTTGGTALENKTYRVPINFTVLEENI
jgi:hypothetical protein